MQALSRLTIVAVALWACSATEARQATIQTPTLQCAHCEETVKAALKEVDGLRDVMVDVEEKRVRVSYDEGATDAVRLAEAIAKVGYEADGVQPDSDAQAALPSCCKVPEGAAHP